MIVSNDQRLFLLASTIELNQTYFKEDQIGGKI